MSHCQITLKVHIQGWTSWLKLQHHLPTGQRRHHNYQTRRKGVDKGGRSALFAISKIDTERQTLLSESDVLLDSLVDAFASCDVKIREVVLRERDFSVNESNFRIGNGLNLRVQRRTCR